MNRNLRLTTAVCLVATAVLALVSAVLAPEFLSDPAAQLAELADAGPTATASSIAFLVSQLPFAIGMVGLAAWLVPASRRLAIIGGVLAVLGAFGHAVIGGGMMLQPLMADSTEHRDAYATLVEDWNSWPVAIPFFAAGLIGTVLGILLLSIAHFRSRREPRWIGPALWAFLLVEFVGASFSDWASHLAALIYVAALCTLAYRIATAADEPALEAVARGVAT